MPKLNSSSEGRAMAARPSLCLLLLCLSAVFAFNAQAAHAEQPKALTLSGTVPTSIPTEPAGSTTPRVRGSDEGIGKSVVHFGLSRPISAATFPDNIVKI